MSHSQLATLNIFSEVGFELVVGGHFGALAAFFVEADPTSACRWRNNPRPRMATTAPMRAKA